jgi:hypothetical protein
VTDPAFEPSAGEGSRDYQDVEEAARELGGRRLDGGAAAGADIRPIEESGDVAAAVDDEAPVPELAEVPEPARTEPPKTEPPAG